MSKETKPILNDKQRLFCQEYLIDLNATQAAIRAGYSEKTAKDIGCENLAKPNIQEFIQELMAKRSEKTEITAERVLNELAKIGFSNIQDYIKEGYTLDEICKLEKDKASAIESVKIKQTHGDYPSTEVSFKLHDKLAALEKIAKHIGFFSEDNKQKQIPVKQVFQIGGQTIEF